MYFQKAIQGTFLCMAAFFFYNSSTGKEYRMTLNVHDAGWGVVWTAEPAALTQLLL